MKIGEKFKKGYVRWEQFDFSRSISTDVASAITEFCQANKVVEIQSFVEMANKRYLLGYIAEEDETARRERNADVRMEVSKVPENAGSEENNPTAGPATEELS